MDSKNMRGKATKETGDVLDEHINESSLNNMSDCEMTRRRNWISGIIKPGNLSRLERSTP
jgi:hypothetical protein